MSGVLRVGSAGVSEDTKAFFLSLEEMAEERVGHPNTTLSWVCLTSDGGLTLAVAGVLR